MPPEEQPKKIAPSMGLLSPKESAHSCGFLILIDLPASDLRPCQWTEKIITSHSHLSCIPFNSCRHINAFFIFRISSTLLSKTALTRVRFHMPSQLSLLWSKGSVHEQTGMKILCLEGHKPTSHLTSSGIVSQP